MADRIITVTDPSVVTNDTLSGYNNYSDQDGQLGTTMTPTEATNGHTVALSDGVIHEVTTKPVGTTNGEFSAVVSNSVEVDLTAPVEQWDISLATYSGISTDISGQVTAQANLGLAVNPAKTKLFCIVNTDKTLLQYSINGDGSLTFDSISLDISSLAGSIFAGIAMSEDGRHLVLATNNADVWIYDIALGDVGTIDNLTATPDRQVTGLGGDAPTTVWLENNGTTYYQSKSNGTMRRGTIDLSAGTLTDESDLYTLPGILTYSCQLGDSGNKIYAVDQVTHECRQFSTATPYVLAGSTDDANPLDVTVNAPNLKSMWTDGITLYIYDSSDWTIHKYDM